MIKRIVLVFFVTVFGAGCVTDMSHQQSDPNVILKKLADDYYKKFLLKYTSEGTYAGLTDSPHNKLDENSLSDLAIWRAREDIWYEEIKRLKPKTDEIEDIALLGSLEQALKSSIDLRVCKLELWQFNHFDGWHNSMLDLMSKQPMESGQDKINALERYSALPLYVDVEISNLRQGLSQGYSMPKPVVRIVIDDIEKLLATEKEKSVFYLFSRAKEGEPFSEAWEEVVATKVIPSYEKYLTFLKGEYLQKARVSMGLNSLPENRGLPCYLAHVNKATTLNMSIEEIQTAGQAFENEFRPQFYTLMKELYDAENFDELRKTTKADEFNYLSKEEFLEAGKAFMETFTNKSKDWFSALPSIPVIFEVTPEDRMSASPARYFKGNDKKPARVWITFDKRYKKYNLPTYVAHEGIPGHHMGFIPPDTHPLLQILDFGSFNEGWAKYAERLVYEDGLFGKEGDLGFLLQLESAYETVQGDMGIHVEGWSRQEAKDWAISKGYGKKRGAERFVNRRVAWPAQTMSYLYGSIEIHRLREQSKKELGVEFDLKEFHDQLLKNGLIPLRTLREVVARWIAAKKAS